MNTAKTAVTVLQELMTKLGETPEYECITQSGPKHLATFEYRCQARGVSLTASARSKKEAKQEVARLMLLALSARGEPVPPPYNVITRPTPVPNAYSSESANSSNPLGVGSNPLPSHSYVALLNDLCLEYHLPGVEYELVSDTGPAHMRRFTMRATLGQHTRLATSSTKKTARQLAAEQLYKYMRENLSRVTNDFVEEVALARAHERVMERYVEETENAPWRPNLGLVVADYHLSLSKEIDSSKREIALNAIKESDGKGSEGLLDRVVQMLDLTLTRTALSSLSNSVCTVEIGQTTPLLTFAGQGQHEADNIALNYLRMTLVPLQC